VKPVNEPDHRGLQGHHKVVVYNKDGSSVELPPIDAVCAVQSNPETWSYTPWKPSHAGHGKAKRLPAGGSHHHEPPEAA
jgi:hypothetical protein